LRSYLLVRGVKVAGPHDTSREVRITIAIRHLLYI